MNLLQISINFGILYEFLEILKGNKIWKLEKHRPRFVPRPGDASLARWPKWPGWPGHTAWRGCAPMAGHRMKHAGGGAAASGGSGDEL
jgi:hypothetical protein